MKRKNKAYEEVRLQVVREALAGIKVAVLSVSMEFILRPFAAGSGSIEIRSKIMRFRLRMNNYKN